MVAIVLAAKAKMAGLPNFILQQPCGEHIQLFGETTSNSHYILFPHLPQVLSKQFKGELEPCLNCVG